MPNYTPNYNLTKPLQTESYNIDVFNANADIIDTQLAANALNGPKVDQILQDTTDIKETLPTIGKTKRRKVFTSNGSWTAPAGVNVIFVTGGGGGGSGSLYKGNATNGQSGGVTSFGTLLSLSGGGGGNSDANYLGARIGRTGGPGGQNGGLAYNNSNATFFGSGGSSGMFKGGQSTFNPSNGSTINNSVDGGYCSGGGSIISINSSAGCGGGGDFVTDYPLNVVPGTSYPITIGKGGIGPSSGDVHAGNGGDGILIIEWWE